MGYLVNKSISETFLKFFLVIGFLGSYTTFSAFSFDVLELFNNHKFLESFLYILISIVGSLGFCYMGYTLLRI
jgi:CrcB protein